MPVIKTGSGPDLNHLRENTQPNQGMTAMKSGIYAGSQPFFFFSSIIQEMQIKMIISNIALLVSDTVLSLQKNINPNILFIMSSLLQKTKLMHKNTKWHITIWAYVMLLLQEEKGSEEHLGLSSKIQMQIALYPAKFQQ